LASSQLFSSVWDIEKHPIAITFVWNKNKWTVSLYTTEETGIDVSEIAKSYGGGGINVQLVFSVKNYLLSFVSRLIALECRNRKEAKNATKETNLL